MDPGSPEGGEIILPEGERLEIVPSEPRARASWRPTPPIMKPARLIAEAGLAADAMLRAAEFIERQDGFSFQGELNPHARASELRMRRDALIAAVLAVRS
jgi:hypothetical protein